MTRIELRKIALSYVKKGYSDYGKLMYSDDLYDATEEEMVDCGEFLAEVLSCGMANFDING